MTMLRLLCLFGRHLRSRRHSLKSRSQMRSQCARCGIPMIRDEKRIWHVDRTRR